MKNKFKYTMPAAALTAVLLASGCGADPVTPSETASQTAAAAEGTETSGRDSVGAAAVMTVPENTVTYAEEAEASPETVSEEVTTVSAEPEEEPLYDLQEDGEGADAGFIDESFAEGDIVIIGIGSNFLDCSVKYGNVKLLEDESTSGSLYFQGVTEGKDNIVISESTDSGVVFREYAVIINEDLSVDLYPSNDFSLYTAQ